jgi:hypothetical protein
MSIPQFDNPLERLAVLPNVINWKNGWVDGTQYFMNDVVVEPSSTASYILTGATSLLSTVNPASDPLWSILAGTTQGIVSVNAGAGISITGPPINPYINNIGILDISGGNAITIDKTSPQNPIISCSAFTQIIEGLGITVAGIPDPIITNNGVRTLTQGAGIVISSTTGDVSISNSGIIDILEGTGVSISLGQTPTISNTGVISITPGDNISNTGTASEVILNALIPSLSQFCNVNVIVLSTVPFPIPASTGTATPGVGNVVIEGGAPSSFFANILANGGTLGGLFMIDLNGFSMLYTGSGAVTGFAPFVTQIQFVDSTTAGGPFYYTADSASANRYSGVIFPFPFSLGVIRFVVADARATGMRQVDSFNIINNMSSEVELLGGSSAYATYYPQGVQ